MCKLCNTDREPISELRYSRSNKDTQKYINTVVNYTDEKPCVTCITTYRCIKSRTSTNTEIEFSIDAIILKRLYKYYVISKYKNHSVRYVNIVHRETRFEVRHRNSAIKVPRTQQESVAKNIRIRYRKSTNSTSFCVRVRKDNKKFNKAFTTLEEAILWRDKARLSSTQPTKGKNK